MPWASTPDRGMCLYRCCDRQSGEGSARAAVGRAGGLQGWRRACAPGDRAHDWTGDVKRDGGNEEGNRAHVKAAMSNGEWWFVRVTDKSMKPDTPSTGYSVRNAAMARPTVDIAREALRNVQALEEQARQHGAPRQEGGSAQESTWSDTTPSAHWRPNFPGHEDSGEEVEAAAPPVDQQAPATEEEKEQWRKHSWRMAERESDPGYCAKRTRYLRKATGYDEEEQIRMDDISLRTIQRAQLWQVEEQRISYNTKQMQDILSRKEEGKWGQTKATCRNERDLVDQESKRITDTAKKQLVFARYLVIEWAHVLAELEGGWQQYCNDLAAFREKAQALHDAFWRNTLTAEAFHTQCWTPYHHSRFTQVLIGARKKHLEDWMDIWHAARELEQRTLRQSKDDETSLWTTNKVRDLWQTPFSKEAVEAHEKQLIDEMEEPDPQRATSATAWTARGTWSSAMPAPHTRPVPSKKPSSPAETLVDSDDAPLVPPQQRLKDEATTPRPSTAPEAATEAAPGPSPSAAGTLTAAPYWEGIRLR